MPAFNPSMPEAMKSWRSLLPDLFLWTSNDIRQIILILNLLIVLNFWGHGLLGFILYAILQTNCTFNFYCIHKGPSLYLNIIKGEFEKKFMYWWIFFLRFLFYWLWKWVPKTVWWGMRTTSMKTCETNVGTKPILFNKFSSLLECTTAMFESTVHSWASLYAPLNWPRLTWS